MGNLVRLLLLLLLVYGEFTMSITEQSEDNQQMALDIDQNDTNMSDVDNATNLNGTIAPSGNIRLNNTFIVSTNKSNTPDKIHIVLISENNEPIDEFIANSFLNLKLGNDIPHGNLYKSYRPWYAGLGTTRPPRIKPGKPWPARPEDYANFSVTTGVNGKIEDRYEESSTETVETAQTLTDNPDSIIPTPKSDRPSLTGLGTTRPPRIKPGKPWPARPEDYANFSVTIDGNGKIEDRYEESSTEAVETAQTSSDNPDSIIPTPKSDRPSFAGLGTTRPPRIKPGKPWPARPEDYANFSVTIDGNGKIEDRYEESSTEAVETAQTSSDNPDSIIPTPKSDRPSFAGLGTTRPPRIKPGKPWPARPEDYANFSVTTDGNGKIEDRYEESSTEAEESVQTSSDDPDSIKPTPKSDRPSFAGLGTTRPPRIKPGKPWPARPEDYANFSVTIDGNGKIEDRYEESSTEAVETAQTSSDNPDSIIPTPKSDRPSIAGLGTTRPPRIKPGKPWPARPEDYANFSVTIDGNGKIEDRYEESSTEAVETAQTSSDNPDSIIPTPKSDRPSFAGLGTTRPPRIKPGKPWPARPEDYANFSVTTDGNGKIEDRYEESSTEAEESVQTSSDDPDSIKPTPKSDRPSFAGLGTTRPPRIKPGKPWPARPEDYAIFSVTTDGNGKIEDRYEESSTKTEESVQTSSDYPENRYEESSTEAVETAQTSSDNPDSIIPTPKSDRPSFAGLGTTRPPRIKPGKPWPARPEDYANFSVTTDGNGKIEDRYEESSTEAEESVQTSSDDPDSIKPTPKSDRPSFAGLGTTRPPRIKPGKPWPARPEDYANFSVTIDGNGKIEDRYEESSTEAVETAQTSSDNPDSIIPTPKSDRPSIAGLGTTRPPRIKPGKPWPARPEDYANFSVTIDGNGKIEDRYEESSTEAVETAQTSSDNPDSIIPTPKSDRPSFAGLGTTRPPRIKPGKPWPARPEDYANFSVTTDGNGKIEDRYEESSTEAEESVQTSSDDPDSIKPTPKSDRPSFAGLGTTRPPRIKPGKPWPARPEDYAIFSVTTDGNGKIEDRYEESSTKTEESVQTSSDYPENRYEESYSGAVESVKKEYFEDKSEETTTKIIRNLNLNAVIDKEFKNDNK